MILNTPTTFEVVLREVSYKKLRVLATNEREAERNALRQKTPQAVNVKVVRCRTEEVEDSNARSYLFPRSLAHGS